MIKTRLEPGEYGAWGCFFEPDSVVRELSLVGKEPVSDDSTFSMVICLHRSCVSSGNILNKHRALLFTFSPCINKPLMYTALSEYYCAS